VTSLPPDSVPGWQISRPRLATRHSRDPPAASATLSPVCGMNARFDSAASLLLGAAAPGTSARAPVRPPWRGSRNQAHRADQGRGHAGVVGYHSGAGGRFKFAAPALKLRAIWVERWVVPPAPHVNITKFEDCSLAEKRCIGRLAARHKTCNSDIQENKIEKSQQTGAGDGNRTRMTSLEGW
jgi:hypothetical protein